MKIRNEKGQALPLAMIAILVGALVIPPFLGYTGTSLIGSRNYGDILEAQYACDSGVEHAIWNLTEGGIENSIDDSGEFVSYNLTEAINGLTTGVKISNAWEIIAWDDFESGDWAGGEGWLGDWTYSGDASVTTLGTPFEGTYHLRLRSSTGVANRSVDLSRQISAHLRFWARVNSFEPANTVICRISHDGVDWTTVYTWTQSDSDDTYHYYDINLTPYGLTETFWISFQSNMNSTGDYFYVDDLDIVWPATEVELMADEDFESGDWTGGEGWLDAWTHTGASSVNATGTPYEGSYHLLLQGTDGYAARATDLSVQSIAHLRFWAKVNDFEGDEYVYCLVSSNGTDWGTVYTWYNDDDDNTYHHYDIDISDYDLTEECWVAFEADMSGADDYFYVDDISIDAVRAYCITATAGGRILKVAVDLMDGLENVLCWYFLV